MSIISIPVACDYHEVHAIVEPLGDGITGVVALYCTDCDERFDME